MFIRPKDTVRKKSGTEDWLVQRRKDPSGAEADGAAPAKGPRPPHARAHRRGRRAPSEAVEPGQAALSRDPEERRRRLLRPHRRHAPPPPGGPASHAAPVPRRHLGAVVLREERRAQRPELVPHRRTFRPRAAPRAARRRTSSSSRSSPRWCTWRTSPSSSSTSRSGGWGRPAGRSAHRCIRPTSSSSTSTPARAPRSSTAPGSPSGSGRSSSRTGCPRGPRPAAARGCRSAQPSASPRPRGPRRTPAPWPSSSPARPRRRSRP